MNVITMKKQLIVGTMIGGILLAATITPFQAVFALSDTPSNTAQSSSTTTAQPQTPSGDMSSTGASGTGTPSADPSNSNPAGPTDSSGTQSSGDTQASSTPSGDSTTTTQTPPADTSDSSSASGTTQNTPDNTPGAQADTANTPSNPSGNTPTTSSGASATQNNTNGTVNNTEVGTAQSGDVNAKGNTKLGNVSSGSASATSTTVNSLNSSTSLAAKGGLQTFTYDINGNHNGNIVLNPTDIMPASSGNVAQDPGNIDTTSQAGDTITNNITLSAGSGNVNVEGNLSAGSVSSGDAATEANIINMISSVVTDKQAFLGVININGNLNGNILLPSSFVDSILSNQTATNNSRSAGSSVTTTDNNLSVNNDVTLNAQTGEVTVEGNGPAGNVTSGDASSSVKLYNMTNSNIVGGNVLLVFVNVMGSWVGLLMNAPAGTTMAGLGGGITQSTPTATGNTNTTNTTSETINNLVNLNSKSGDVAVKGNETAGNTTSGKATANADIVNILGSQIDLTGWLGVLIINVYGSWNGSLELQPAAATITVHAPPHHHAKHTASSTPVANEASTLASPLIDDAILPAAAHILGDAIKHTPAPPGTNKHIASIASNTHSSKGVLADYIIGGVAFIVAAMGAATRLRFRRKNI